MNMLVTACPTQNKKNSSHSLQNMPMSHGSKGMASIDTSFRTP
jgi:hypothetical protein